MAIVIGPARLGQADWATLEATRLTNGPQRAFNLANGNTVVAVAVRRAPGLMAAAEALCALSHPAEALSVLSRAEAKVTLPALPVELTKFVDTRAIASTDAALLSRVCAWLAANPYEISKAKTPLAALAAVSAVSRAPAVDAGKVAELEELCRTALVSTCPTLTVAKSRRVCEAAALAVSGGKRGRPRHGVPAQPPRRRPACAVRR